MQALQSCSLWKSPAVCAVSSAVAVGILCAQGTALSVGGVVALASAVALAVISLVGMLLARCRVEPVESTTGGGSLEQRGRSLIVETTTAVEGTPSVTLPTPPAPALSVPPLTIPPTPPFVVPTSEASPEPLGSSPSPVTTPALSEVNQDLAAVPAAKHEPLPPQQKPPVAVESHPESQMARAPDHFLGNIPDDVAVIWGRRKKQEARFCLKEPQKAEITSIRVPFSFAQLSSLANSDDNVSRALAEEQVKQSCRLALQEIINQKFSKLVIFIPKGGWFGFSPSQSGVLAKLACCSSRYAVHQPKIWFEDSEDLRQAEQTFSK